jgi:hypothetical protein
MNPFYFLKLFAWIAIVGLCCTIFLDYWLPILIGAVMFTLMVKAVTPRRHY